MNRSLMFLFLAVLLLASVSLAACGSTTSTSAAPVVSTPTPAGAGGTTIVIDALDRTVEFPAPPQRIVIAGKNTLAIVEALYLYPEAADRLVGLVVGQQKLGPFLSLVDPAFDQKAVLPVEAGPEQIAPLHPDVVVAHSFMAETLGKSLEQVGIPVVYVDLETPMQYFRDVTTLGRLLGDDARALEIRAFYRTRMDGVYASLQGLNDGEKPRVLVVQYSDKGGAVALNVPSAAWLQTSEVEFAGGLPVWKEAAQGGGWTVVNLEQIAAWNPDQIFVVSYKADPSQVVEKLKADSQWQALKAVRAGQIYGFASDIFSWDQPDPRWILGLTWLAGKMHRDRFARLNMKDEASQFFEQMYGLDPATVEEKILPALKGDIE